MQTENNLRASGESMRKQPDASTQKTCDFFPSANEAINERKRPLQGLKYFWDHRLSSDGHVKDGTVPFDSEALPILR